MTGERMKALVADYGKIAIGTYLALFVLTLTGFVVAISMGVAVEGVASGAGLLGAAYLGTKLTQPLRIGATLVLTPLVARVIRRRWPAKLESTALPPKAASDDKRPVVDDERTE